MTPRNKIKYLLERLGWKISCRSKYTFNWVFYWTEQPLRKLRAIRLSKRLTRMIDNARGQAADLSCPSVKYANRLGNIHRVERQEARDRYAADQS
jgi:hypothetical protein